MSSCWCGSFGEGCLSSGEAVPFAFWRCRAERFPAVVAAEQEDETVQVPPQLHGVVGRVAGAIGKQGNEAAGVTGEPAPMHNGSPRHVSADAFGGGPAG
jgi:hypothetical protein